jgi:CheY-like chemotaxis protein
MVMKTEAIGVNRVAAHFSKSARSGAPVRVLGSSQGRTAVQSHAAETGASRPLCFHVKVAHPPKATRTILTEKLATRPCGLLLKGCELHGSPYTNERGGRRDWSWECASVRPRVLIVDDHAIIRKMLHELFAAHDMDVSEAENGAEGVQRAQELNPALVILDLSMPFMNGLEAARELRLTMPHVPLLMFTNNNIAAMRKEAHDAGIRAVVSKSDANASLQLVAQAKTLLGLDGADIQGRA